MPEEICFYSRKDEYGWMSNFECSAQFVDGHWYKSNEHYYQSMKAKDSRAARWIADAPTPYMAMITGRNLRPEDFVDNWDDIKVNIMLKGLRAKFKDSELQEKLLSTGDAILHEASPEDMFWGMNGEDMLGKLLMQVREEIRGGTT